MSSELKSALIELSLSKMNDSIVEFQIRNPGRFTLVTKRITEITKSVHYRKQGRINREINRS